MRTSLFARALAAVAATSVLPLAVIAVTPSHRSRVPVHVLAASAAIAAEAQASPPTPTTASVPAPPVGNFAGVPYGPAPSELLDLYLPERSTGTGPVPVIVYLHSGGWVAGSRANVNDAAAVQVARGFAVASIDYELATRGGGGSFPGAVFDVKRAIRFLKANAAGWGLDPTRVIVMGASAGGHLAALVGASAGQLEPDLAGPLAAVDSSVRAVVDLVGITDLATFATAEHPWAGPLTAGFLGCPLINGKAMCPPDLFRRASVATYLTPAAPPIFMAYGGADTLVVPATQGAPLAAIWAQAHGGDPQSVSYEVVAGAGHNLSAAQVNLTALDGFLDRAIAAPSFSARAIARDHRSLV
jgi:acetyl esterase/lipase